MTVFFVHKRCKNWRANYLLFFGKLRGPRRNLIPFGWECPCLRYARFFFYVWPSLNSVTEAKFHAAARFYCTFYIFVNGLFGSWQTKQTSQMINGSLDTYLLYRHEHMNTHARAHHYFMKLVQESCVPREQMLQACDHWDWFPWPEK